MTATFGNIEYNQFTMEFYEPTYLIKDEADFPNDEIVVHKAPLFPEHMMLNLIAWGIMADFPIMIIRYCKTYKWYILWHRIIFEVISIMSLIAQIAIIVQKRADFRFDAFRRMGLERKIHMVFGTSFFFINVFQVVQGYLHSYIVQNRETKWANYYEISKQVHNYIGYIMYYIGKFLLLNGLWISFFGHFNEYVIILLIYFIVNILSRVLLEVFYQKKYDFILKFLNLQSQKAEETFSQNVSMSFNTNLVSHMELQEFDNIMKEYPNKKWVIFNNSVIDVSELIHPGGQSIWEECQGREVARFVYGAFGLESTTMNAYKHSEYTLKLLEKYTIDNLLTIPLFSEDQTNPHVWTIVGLKQLSKYNKLFEFARQGVTFQTTLNGIEHFGRYFLMKSYSNSKISIRPYTLLLCMARCNQSYRQYVIQYCAEKLNFPEIQQGPRIEKPVYAFQANEFPLIIKKYPSNTGFSQYIHSLSIGDNVYLSGPFGTAFGIDIQEAGTIVLITGGTGVLPFLDLIEFHLKKTLYTLLKQRSKKEADEINPSNINFDRYFKPTFKMVFLLAVQGKEDLIGRDIYFTLARVQRLLPQPNFEMIMSMNEKFDEKIPGVNYVGKARFDNAFFEKYVPNVRKVSRFILCGPPPMVRLVPAGLQAMGIHKDKIYLV